MRTLNPMELLKAVREGAVTSLSTACSDGGVIGAQGSSGSSTSLLLGSLALGGGRPLLLVVAHVDEADVVVDELASFGVQARRFCAIEALPGESSLSMDLLADRLSLVQRVVKEGLADGDVIVAPIQALMQRVPRTDELAQYVLSLNPGDERGPEAIARWLVLAGYQRLDAIEEPGDFAVRGGIIDIFPPGAASDGAAEASAIPVRLDFFGEELEAIAEVDLETMGSDRRLEHIELIGSLDDPGKVGANGVCFLELMPPETVAILHETTEVTEQARGYFERVTSGKSVLGPPAVLKLLRERFHAFVEVGQFSGGAGSEGVRMSLPVETLPGFATNAEDAVDELVARGAQRRTIVVCQNEAEQGRLGELLAERSASGAVESCVAYVHRGFIWGDAAASAVIVPYHELMNRFQTRRHARRMRVGRAMDAFVDINAGDIVVHTEHGLAKFLGLKTMTSGRGTKGREPSGEYLTLEFASKAKLHVPVAQIDKVQRYIGTFRGKPALSTLGGKRWNKQKQDVREAVRDLAAEMLRIQAAREHLPGVRYPEDTMWQREFEEEFPYEETEDQLAAIEQVKKDMCSLRPMDRLVCGDVGYGKTEVAIRAAFKAAEFGKQVAVLVPTTVLAEQHERTFRDRFAGYPFRIESVSRFKSKQDQRAVLEEAGKGRIDILVGTHRLLSNDVRFKDLGLVVVDEEQRFGVEHKQRLLSLRMTVDVLTLSATPIPRTLHMALLGLRDISSLTTAPMDRRSIVTEVIPYNEKRLERSLARELSRDGQVFYVHNRVKTIHKVAARVREMAPDARVVVGHGQMPAGELEKVMLQIVQRQADILVCTTIIESGVDIPTANTIIIDNADRFGLADLHQLRGRVGRHKHRAYCYLLLPDDRTITPSAKRRLKAIEEFSMLGSGFKIAMRDLEIRGAGNILGADQSGHIAAVGYELYCQLLDQAVRELKDESTARPTEVLLEIGMVGVIPKGYIPSDRRRLEAYRRLATVRTVEDVAAFEEDLTQAYGEPPRAVKQFVHLAEVRVLARAISIRSIIVREPDVVLRCEETAPVVNALADAQGTVRPLPKRKGDELFEVYYRPPASYLEPESLVNVLRARFWVEKRAVVAAT